MQKTIRKFNVKNASDAKRRIWRHGFKFCGLLQDSSSSGDWDYIVSDEGKNWYIMSQTNCYPIRSFEVTVSECLFHSDKPLSVSQAIEIALCELQ